MMSGADVLFWCTTRFTLAGAWIVVPTIVLVLAPTLGATRRPPEESVRVAAESV